MVEPLSDARTPLADFFSILLVNIGASSSDQHTGLAQPPLFSCPIS